MSDYTDHAENPEHEEVEPVRDYRSRSFWLGILLAYSVLINFIFFGRLSECGAF